ncbi:hypothetical protein EV360DRAFT_73741 [Lentinula raphanica]|nr:hypothetical protein EV360DRAFT_73741 [Lentinula raphanica]
MRLSTGTMSVISAIFASAVCALPVDNVYSAATGFLHNPQGEVTKNLYPRGCGWSDLLCRGQSKSTTTAQPGSDASAHLSSVRQTNPIRGSSSSLPHGHTSSSVPQTDLIRASSSSLFHGRTPSSGPQTDGGSDPIKESPPSSLPRGRTSSSGPQTEPIRGPSSSSLLHGRPSSSCTQSDSIKNPPSSSLSHGRPSSFGTQTDPVRKSSSSSLLHVRPSSSGTQAGMIRESLSSSQTDVGDPNQKKQRLEYTLCNEDKKEFCQDIYDAKTDEYVQYIVQQVMSQFYRADRDKLPVGEVEMYTNEHLPTPFLYVLLTGFLFNVPDAPGYGRVGGEFRSPCNSPGENSDDSDIVYADMGYGRKILQAQVNEGLVEPGSL